MFRESKVDLKVLCSAIFEGNTELLAGLALLDNQRNNFISTALSHDKFLLTDQTGDLYLACKQNLDSLLLSKLLPVSEEFLHTVIVVHLQEIFEAFLYSELLVSISKETNVYYG